MSKTTKAAGMAAATTAAAVQPGGLRKVAAGCLLVGLIGVLILGGLIGVLAWWAGRPPAGLPCPQAGPVRLAVAQTFPPAPKAAQEAVEDALRAAGRKVKTVSAGSTGSADVRVVWFEGSALTVGRSEQPVVITIGGKVTPAQVRAALAEKGQLPGCSTAAPNPPTAEAGPPNTFAWPWRGQATLAAVAALVLASWWAVGPEVTKVTGRALAALGRLLARVARPAVEQVRRAVHWVEEGVTGTRGDRRAAAREAALTAEQIAASATRQQAQEAAEKEQAEREAAGFQRFWGSMERARIEHENEETK